MDFFAKEIKNGGLNMFTEIFVVCNKTTPRSYPVAGTKGCDLDTIWNSQKSWFTKGNQVTITDEDGRSKTYIKE